MNEGPTIEAVEAMSISDAIDHLESIRSDDLRSENWNEAHDLACVIATLREARALALEEGFRAGFHAAERALGFEDCDESNEAVENEWSEFRALANDKAATLGDAK